MKTLNKILLTLGIASLSSINVFSQEYNIRDQLFNRYKECVPEEFKDYQRTGNFEIMEDTIFFDTYNDASGRKTKFPLRAILLNIDEDPNPDAVEYYEVNLDDGGNIVNQKYAPYMYSFFRDNGESVKYIDFKADGLNCNEVEQWNFMDHLSDYFNYRSDVNTKRHN
jgi:hypothetical protein